VNVLKYLERYGKRIIRSVARHVLKSDRIRAEEIDTDLIARILVVRQDGRLGNLVLMSPLLSALKAALPDAVLDVLISEGFEEVLAVNPNVDHVRVFRKRRAQLLPWTYVGLIRELRKAKYDLAVDVSNGYHFSLNGALLTRLSGARCRVGYDREDAGAFMNVLVPLPPPDTHMADAMRDIVKPILPGILEYRMAFYVSEGDRNFAAVWLHEHDITEYDSYFFIHPGGKGEKRWGARNFAGLIDRIAGVTGARMVVAGSAHEHEIIQEMSRLSRCGFDVLVGVTVGQMAAVIERCDLFISGDTGPMHVAAALGRPVVAVFLSSDYRVFGPRGKYGRIVAAEDGPVTIDDVVTAIWDILSIDEESEK
jgi:heptosyltransferase-2/heptosyltransferase-3